jgi:bifunctional DNase/RNase
VESATGDETEIDSRTSDAIAVAVRTGSPIYADERVLDEAGVEPEAAVEGDPVDEERLAVFREFVNSLDIDLPGTGGEPGGPEES